MRSRIMARLRAVPSERWFLLTLGLLLAAFAVALFLQPRVGGGGR